MRSHVPLTFPATRRALWCHQLVGEPVVLRCNALSVCVTEQALYLAYGLSRTAKSSHCWLVGEVNVEADCSEVVIHLDQLESSERDSIFPGSLHVSTKLVRNSRHLVSSELESTAVANAVTHLTNRAQQANKVHVSEFMHATAECTIFAGTNQICCDLNIDMVLPNCRFEAAPIEAVIIAPTALSKSILGTDKHGIVSTQHKSGYLTMDQYRKVIFLLESDPKVLTVPIIGIWVSGVEFITHPYIWACCVRYMHTAQIKDRVAKPLQPFLLIHKSPLMSSAQYFDCKPHSNNLNYSLLSGSHRFSMDKEVSGKRGGHMSVKLDPQELSSPRGLQFATMVQECVSKLDVENNCTPITKKQRNKVTDDSLPWSSPVPDYLQGEALAPAVPDVSLLDESNPLEAPRPQRLVLQKIMDSRLNCSPHKKPDTIYVDEVARKITFESAENGQYKSQHPLSPSLRASRPINCLPEDDKQRLISHSANTNVLPPFTGPQSTFPVSTHPQLTLPVSTYTQPSLQVFTHTQPSLRVSTHTQPSLQVSTHTQLPLRVSTHTQPSLQVSTHPQHVFQASTHTQPALQVSTHRQPALQVSARPQVTEELPMPTYTRSTYPCAATQTLLCPAPGHCCHHSKCSHCNNSGQPWHPFPPSHACQENSAGDNEYKTHNGDTTPKNPLNIITANVRRLLSPQQRYPNTSTAIRRTEELNTSSYAIPEQSHPPCPCTPPATSTQNLPMSPEVEEILRQQDAQLKALQQQIEKLLQSQRVESPPPTQKFASTQTTAVAAVNTGVSLFEGYDSCTSDTQHSGNDSSRSQSLIQHDLTALDLPTQVTARSFTSDINVDYDSYEDSFTGAPKRDDSSNSVSEDSWLSPVLGESVSMMGESVNPESTKQQLDDIIKNVRDLLAKSVTAERGDGVADREVDESENGLAELSKDSDTSVASVNECSDNDTNIAHVDVRRTDDLAQSTRNQLQKMGINMEPPGHIGSESLPMLPRLQYLSMVMTDTTMDCNTSLELNALALKYLHDEQLTELAHLTVHTGSRAYLPREGSLLRQVLMMPSGDSAARSSLRASDMSMATQQYLKRYELDTSASEGGSDTSLSTPQLLDLTPANHLKSILRKEQEIPSNDQKQCNTEQDMSLQVLDIARLRELPKLL